VLVLIFTLVSPPDPTISFRFLLKWSWSCPHILAQLAEMPKLLGQTLWLGFGPRFLHFVCVRF
jgi:hypothetical protein